jgi:Na+-transporting NADH:ubiquinone oxidoreductase subunit NqrC
MKGNSKRGFSGRKVIPEWGQNYVGKKVFENYK